ncbi:MAG: DHH family phosphoesterase [Firmicutes bacterium]|nr:bifunctional oligoribonuclease/PAP phosphatase NrnA [Clostridiales bacterium]MBQ4340257.1 DHH family phosphoesterase [Bacillota bacterium]
MKNNSLSEIAKIMESADSLLFLTHVITDGDAAGSAAALCRVMEGMGKTAHVFTGEELPNNIKFLEYESFIKREEDLLDEYDLAVAVDCSDEGRFENRALCYKKGRKTVNIDHHMTNNGYADFNYVEGDAAAAGEIVYRLIETAGWNIDEKTAEALYVAIVTDTGQFQYSSTTSETHRIAAELIDKGIDLNTISVNVYQSVRKLKYILQGEILRTVEFLENDRFAIAFADQDMFKRTGAEIQDSDGIVELLRDIDTVEVSAFAKETAPGVMKLGFRSKYDLNVGELSAKFGGGGHAKAAGCTILGGIEDVKKAIYPEISKLFEDRKSRS